MTALTSIDLFSGIGGFALGLDRAGVKPVAFSEIDAYRSAELKRHWPDVPNYGDIRQFDATRLSADIVAGGFPCRDTSEANTKGKGLDGEQSGLWREFFRIICEVRPRYAIVENPRRLRWRGLGRILGDLASIGYDAEWHSIRAADIGAPHRRERIFVIAYPDPARGRAFGLPCGRMARDHPILSGEKITGGFARFSETAWPSSWSDFISNIGRVDDGLSAGLAPFNAYADSIVPQIAQIIGEAIVAADGMRELRYEER